MTNSVGQLISSNQVVYPNAFEGVDADLLYTYTRAGLEQDIVLEQQLPPPESFGLNSQAAMLQVITEFFDAPAPAITSRTFPEAGANLTDQTLDFGAMRMLPGNALFIGDTNASADDQIMVAKQWMSLDGHKFLIEQVPVAALANELSELPSGQISIKKSFPSKVISRKSLLSPGRPPKSAGTRSMQAKLSATPFRGLALDYKIMLGLKTNFTFQADTTYYIAGAVNLYGTNTFEGGAVLKYASGGYLELTPAPLADAVNWQAGPYRPVIFTAVDDNSVGDTISGSTGNPSGYYANPALEINLSAGSPPPLSGFRITYALQAVELIGGVLPKFYNGQIIDCDQGVTISEVARFYLRNILFSDVGYGFNNLAHVNFDVQNCTFNSSTYLSTAVFTPFISIKFYFTICFFSSITNFTQRGGTQRKLSAYWQ